MRSPLNLKFANYFIIYQKCPFRGRIVPGRLHSELCARGVNMSLKTFQYDLSPLFQVFQMVFLSAIQLYIQFLSLKSTFAVSHKSPF